MSSPSPRSTRNAVLIAVVVTAVIVLGIGGIIFGLRSGGSNSPAAGNTPAPGVTTTVTTSVPGSAGGSTTSPTTTPASAPLDTTPAQAHLTKAQKKALHRAEVRGKHHRTRIPKYVGPGKPQPVKTGTFPSQQSLTQKLVTAWEAGDKASAAAVATQQVIDALFKLSADSDAIHFAGCEQDETGEVACAYSYTGGTVSLYVLTEGSSEQVNALSTSST